MSESFLQLALANVATALILGLTAIPWLLAIDYRNWRHLRSAKAWGIGVGAAVGVGIAIAVFLEQNNEPRTLIRVGRFLTSLVQLELSADFFVLIFAGLLKFWPKGGAVALAAYREGLRQPMFWLLFGFAAFLMMASPFFPFFTFGEDLKMVKELCYALTMLMPALFGVVAASMSVSEEIEGRTAVTLMSKPISRRQFLIGKFLGLLLASLSMAVLLGWILVWVVLFKPWYDSPIVTSPEYVPDPALVIQIVDDWYPQSALGDFLKGVGFWIYDATVALPGLVISFCQVMVLLAIAVALATRLPMLVTLVVCLVVYFLGHLTPVMTQVSRGNRLIQFFAQMFDYVLPGLDLFDVGSAVIRDLPLPAGEYAFYTANVAFYALTYTAIALLFGLILFEDRDLA